MRNIRLVVAYDGTDFFGWQRQPNAPTIQGTLEAAIAKLVGEPARVWGSGRTDAGVHAAHQVANFKTACPIPCPNLTKALNDLLPAAVRVKEAEEVPEDFHARYQARSRTYRYRILLAPFGSPFLVRFVWHYPYPLNRMEMAGAAKGLEGEHDFASFAGSDERAAGSEDAGAELASTVRTIFAWRLLWRPRRSLLIYEVKANGFLYHMVRNILGTLVEVGRGKLAASDVMRVLAARDRRLAGPTAPPSGLCLVKVEY